MGDLTSQLAEAEKQLDSQTGLTDGSIEEDKRNRSETWNFFCFYKKIITEPSPKYQKCVFIRRHIKPKAKNVFYIRAYIYTHTWLRTV